MEPDKKKSEFAGCWPRYSYVERDPDDDEQHQDDMIDTVMIRGGMRVWVYENDRMKYIDTNMRPDLHGKMLVVAIRKRVENKRFPIIAPDVRGKLIDDANK